jgi:hypothetical protein
VTRNVGRAAQVARHRQGAQQEIALFFRSTLVVEIQSLNHAGMSRKGGKRAYKARPGKDRSPDVERTCGARSWSPQLGGIKPSLAALVCPLFHPLPPFGLRPLPALATFTAQHAMTA